MISSLDQTDSRPRNAVIMGCGRIGASIANALSEEGYSVRILDPNPASFDLLPSSPTENQHVQPIVGDGTLEQDLRRASTQDADVFIAVSGKDTRNALAAQLAKHILLVPMVVCRINDPTRKEMYDQLGMVTISATKLVTEMVQQATAR